MNLSLSTGQNSTDEVVRERPAERRVSECGSLTGRTAALETLNGSGSLITSPFQSTDIAFVEQIYVVVVSVVGVVRPCKVRPCVGNAIPPRVVVTSDVKFSVFGVDGPGCPCEETCVPFHH